MNKTEEFIKKAIEKHGDRYDYSKVEYIKAINKVIIICKTHGEFEQTPHKHLYGGCKKCGAIQGGVGKKHTQEEFINKANKKHNNKYDYSKVNYIGANDKVIIICKIHGEFEQTPNSHNNGSGCPKCGDILIGEKLKKSPEKFIEEAIKIHDEKYDYSKVNYIGANDKVIIICKNHGDFLQQPASHLSGNGCPKCGIIQIGEKLKKTSEKFIKEAIIIHGDIYDYSLVKYEGCFIKINIVCKIHGEFQQTPDRHLCGAGCKKCGNIRTGEKLKKSSEKFIEEANKIHNNKYDYSKVNYIDSKSKVIIICKNHGDFLQQPSNHLFGIGQGCPKCGDIQSSVKNRYTQEEFINKANKIHNNKYDYSNVNYNISKERIIIICNIHGVFEQTANEHLQGRDCNKCGVLSSANIKRKCAEKFIQEAKNIHNDKYDYSLIDYKTARLKIKICCEKHGEFEQTPDSHLRGTGCPKCCQAQYSKLSLQWLKYIENKNNITLQTALSDKGEFRYSISK
jgi:hypothetical protein